MRKTTSSWGEDVSGQSPQAGERLRILYDADSSKIYFGAQTGTSCSWYENGAAFTDITIDSNRGRVFYFNSAGDQGATVKVYSGANVACPATAP